MVVRTGRENAGDNREFSLSRNVFVYFRLFHQKTPSFHVYYKSFNEEMQDNYKQGKDVKVQWKYIVKLQVYQLQVYWYYEGNWCRFEYL